MTPESEDQPQLKVVTPHATVEVANRTTAELALSLVEPVLADYIGQGVGVQQERQQVRHRYPASCDECGYEWERTAADPQNVTCPKCNNYWFIPKEKWRAIDSEVLR